MRFHNGDIYIGDFLRNMIHGNYYILLIGYG